MPALDMSRLDYHLTFRFEKAKALILPARIATCNITLGLPSGRL
jgi:hypothetical protein